ncbi:molybdopterin molybdochelatase [Candidatus Koribacter versatilis Ellin345]|uniref:Molybdopterin molybdenumtransferase n=1 Tax=Koribacter versatilis (strain Ellin345) TaxID=204669 RepID=Q1IHK4_KORVE|nr:gephyrin-like molybdotransferase Glp [Candidatus Koribacter versatilis]ABF43646.1 molybdopterin molybdochelatase [Candidatus Koribacter versatilis Ellin345]
MGNESLSFDEARALVEGFAALVREPEKEHVALLDADGRVLAEELRADRDFPPFHRATRDGFAVRAADTATLPSKLRVIGEIAAGHAREIALNAGEAAEIMTGAPLPDGADGVVMVEYTRRDGEFVVLDRAMRAGENFVPRGAEARAGDLLLEARERLNPAAIAIAASVGKASLAVFRRPVAAILATGDELVEVGENPLPAQIRNSNGYSIAAQVRRAGGDPMVLPIVRDHEDAIRSAVSSAKSADLLILSGGVSMGKYDLVEQVLASEGAQFRMTGAKIQPGKPIVFGTLPREYGDLPFFGLPGNPISTMVTFDLFVAPVLAALGGAKDAPLRFAHAKIAEDFKVAPGLTRFLPAVLASSAAETRVSVVPWHGSGDLAAVVKANCYLVVPPDAAVLAKDSMVSVLLKD